MKKTTYRISRISLIIGLTTLLLTTSCNDFLDVHPAGEVDESEQFSSIRGYRNAMYGIYGSMATPNLYGKNLSYGFVDQLGQQFGYDNSSETSYFVSQYDYLRSDVRTIVDAIWEYQYQTIGYVNNVLRNAEQPQFSHRELPIMRGECHGLRAFLHFDLVRLFAEDYTRGNASTRGIPYATTFDLNNKPLLSLHDTYKQILKDLDEAERLLADDNEVNVEQTPTSDYLKGRAVFFNKYAVAATKARVFYAMNDTANAAKYARMVIAADGNFSLKKLTTMADVKRFPAKGEIIFGLYNNTLSADVSSMFLSQTARGTFTEGRRDLEELYETSAFSATSADLRYTGYFRQNTTPDGIKTYSFVRLLESDTQVNTNPLQGLTLIRIPEMYYILSECTYDNDKSEAVRLLNLVRASRGLEAVAADKVADRTAFDKEVMRERMREMPGEGQSFFALKHYNKPFGDYRGINSFQPSSTIFVLPWPEREKEYGGQ